MVKSKIFQLSETKSRQNPNVFFLKFSVVRVYEEEGDGVGVDYVGSGCDYVLKLLINYVILVNLRYQMYFRVRSTTCRDTQNCSRIVIHRL